MACGGVGRVAGPDGKVIEIAVEIDHALLGFAHQLGRGALGQFLNRRRRAWLAGDDRRLRVRSEGDEGVTGGAGAATVDLDVVAGEATELVPALAGEWVEVADVLPPPCERRGVVTAARSVLLT